MADADTFRAELEALGFRLVQDRRTGMVQFQRQVTRYLSFWVHWNTEDGSVLFTWEHAIGEYLSSIGLQIGSNEHLNQFLFPAHDSKGPQDIAFVVQEMDRAERILAAVDLVGGA